MKRFNKKKRRKKDGQTAKYYMYSCIWFKATLSESFVIQEYDIHVGL